MEPEPPEELEVPEPVVPEPVVPVPEPEVPLPEVPVPVAPEVVLGLLVVPVAAPEDAPPLAPVPEVEELMSLDVLLVPVSELLRVPSRPQPERPRPAASNVETAMILIFCVFIGVSFKVGSAYFPPAKPRGPAGE